MRNYIWFNGGSWGDITANIINGKAIPCDITRLMKSNKPINPAMIESYDTLAGHRDDVLGMGFKNFRIVITDPELLSYAADRFLRLNKAKDYKMVLRHYYPESIHPLIDKADLVEQKKLFIKKQSITCTNNYIPLDFNHIKNTNKHLDMLSEHFVFDRDYAKEVMKLAWR